MASVVVGVELKIFFPLIALFTSSKNQNTVKSYQFIQEDSLFTYKHEN
jgi:hypothetical protein